MARHKHEAEAEAGTPDAPAPAMDTSALTKTETATSHGMMWSISSPAGGVLALVRDEAAADLVMTALAGYTPVAAEPEAKPEGYMSPEEIEAAHKRQQENMAKAGQIPPSGDFRAAQGFDEKVGQEQ